MKWLQSFSILLFVFQASFAHPITLVMIDSKTERALGSFPISRAYYAQAIEVAKKYNAKGLILKFFFDLPKENHSDLLLARAIRTFPVLLQASVNGTENKSNPYPDLLNLSCPSTYSSKNRIAGHSGIIPLPAFSRYSAGVGFVDITQSESVPMLVSYQGRCAPSLWFKALELITQTQGVFDKEGRLFFGKKFINLSKNSSVQIDFPQSDSIVYLSFVDFIQQKSALNKLKNQLIIIAYDGENQPHFKTPLGFIKAHRLFHIQLHSLLSQLESSTKSL